METHIEELKKIKFNNPVLIEGLPGVGNVGRVVAGYMVKELEMKKFAELYSPDFLPLVILNEKSVVSSLKCDFYYHKGKERDIIVFTGDSQSVSTDGHYRLSEKTIEYMKKIGVKEVITIGGFAEGAETENPRVIGAVNNEKLLKKYSKYGIDFGQEHPVGTIVGASGLLLGLSNKRGIDGLCLMGETVGLPLLTDPKAADAVLQILQKIVNVDIDLTKLEKTIKKMHDEIEKTEKIHEKMMKQNPKDDSVKYIG